MAVTPPTLLSLSIGNSQTPTSGANVLTLPGHTVPSGANALFVYVIYDSFFNNVPTVTWGGVTVDRLYVPSTASFRAALYQILDPTPGTGDIVVTGLDSTLAAVAISLADFASVRFAEFTWIFSFDPDTTRLDTSIYAETTDLVLGFAGVYTGNVATPDAGQTLLASNLSLPTGRLTGGCRLAVSQVNTPVNQGLPAASGNVTASGWTTAVQGANSSNNQFLIAFQGLDSAPPATVTTPYIARVTDILSLEQQPAVSPRKWRHQVLADSSLAVIVTYFDTTVASVFWQPLGGAEVALTQLVQSNAAGVWYLAAPVAGIGWLRVVMNGTRWYGATAYTFYGTDVIAGVHVGGISPAGGISIASQPGGIVADRRGLVTGSFVGWTPSGGALAANQPIRGVANIRTATTGSDSGGSSWKVAVGNLTTIGWIQTTGTQGAFSFVGAIPPPPGPTGCPSTLALLPVDGSGCSNGVDTPAV